MHEILKDPCVDDDECQNDGTCEVGICNCKAGCIGKRCETCGKYINYAMTLSLQKQTL